MTNFFCFKWNSFIQNILLTLWYVLPKIFCPKSVSPQCSSLTLIPPGLYLWRWPVPCWRWWKACCRPGYGLWRGHTERSWLEDVRAGAVHHLQPGQGCGPWVPSWVFPAICGKKTPKHYATKLDFVTLCLVILKNWVLLQLRQCTCNSFRGL